MFGAKYNRLKFWIISICLLIPITFAKVFAYVFENNGNDENTLVAYSIVFIIGLIWINTLANRIRDYGSNPWIALFGIIPLVNIGLALYYGIAKSKSKPEKKTIIQSNNNSLTKAVYNHGKDFTSEIKPAINDYKEKHSSQNYKIEEVSNPDTFDMNEDEIYEKIMIEIEENKKIKSTWARALSQSDGNKDKAESIYINLRVDQLRTEHLNSIAHKTQEVKNEIDAKFDICKYDNMSSDDKIKMIWNEKLKKIKKKAVTNSDNHKHPKVNEEKDYSEEKKIGYYTIFSIVLIALAFNNYISKDLLGNSPSILSTLILICSSLIAFTSGYYRSFRKYGTLLIVILLIVFFSL